MLVPDRATADRNARRRRSGQGVNDISRVKRDRPLDQGAIDRSDAKSPLLLAIGGHLASRLGQTSAGVDQGREVRARREEIPAAVVRQTLPGRCGKEVLIRTGAHNVVAVEDQGSGSRAASLKWYAESSRLDIFLEPAMPTGDRLYAARVGIVASVLGRRR